MKILKDVMNENREDKDEMLKKRIEKFLVDTSSTNDRSLMFDVLEAWLRSREEVKKLRKKCKNRRNAVRALETCVVRLKAKLNIV